MDRGYDPNYIINDGDIKFVEWVMGRVHVGTPVREVLRNWKDRARKYPWPVRKQVYRAALKAHRDNLDFYDFVMFRKGGSHVSD